MTDTISQVTGMPPVVSRAAKPSLTEQQAMSDVAMRESAQKLEASFLAEMLKHTGLAKMPESFNGGPGEAAFSDYLVHEYADAISSKGSIGLADHIYRSLVERSKQ